MKLQLKRSNVLTSGAAKVPTASQLEYGELAINYNNSDPAIFLKDSNNNVIRISGVGNIADDGQVELPASTTPPANPEAGNLWFNSDEGRLYIYYVDANTSQWVDASPDSYDPSVVPDMSNPDYQAGTLDDRYNSSQVGTTAPAVTTRQEGALWWNSSANEGKLYVLYNDPAPDGRKKWVEASPYPDTSSYVVKVDNGTQQNITGGGGLTIDGNFGIGTTTPGSYNANADNLVVQNTGGTGSAGMTIRAGTGAQSTVYFADGTGASDAIRGYVQYFHNGDFLRFGTDANERLRIDSAGRVGIGNTVMSSFTGNSSDNLVVGSGSGGEGITVYSATNNQGSITFADGTSGDAAYRGAVEYSHTADSLAFRTAGTGNRMVINSSGNVGVGTTLPAAPLAVLSTSSTYQGMELITPAGDGSGEFIFGVHQSGSSAGRNIVFKRGGTDGTASESMRILSDGTIATGGLTATPSTVAAGSYIQHAANAGFFGNNGDAKFGSSANNPVLFQVNGSEKMRIDTSGDVFIGGTSDANADFVFDSGSRASFYRTLYIAGANAAAAKIALNTSGSAQFGSGTPGGSNVAGTLINGTGTIETQAASGNVFIGRQGSNGVATTTIGQDGTATFSGNVTAYSDIKLKKDIKVIDNALDKVSAIRGVTFERIDQEDEKRQSGVIAQEVEAVLPEVVSTNSEGIKSVAYGNIVGLLIESIKELKLEIETLKAERN